MSAPTTEAVEAAAQTLYRQFRARHGFPAYFGEWDSAGSYQPRFRDDARAILTAAAQVTADDGNDTRVEKNWRHR